MLIRQIPQRETIKVLSLCKIMFFGLKMTPLPICFSCDLSACIYKLNLFLNFRPMSCGSVIRIDVRSFVNLTVILFLDYLLHHWWSVWIEGGRESRVEQNWLKISLFLANFTLLLSILSPFPLNLNGPEFHIRKVMDSDASQYVIMKWI